MDGIKEKKLKSQDEAIKDLLDANIMLMGIIDQLHTRIQNDESDIRHALGKISEIERRNASSVYVRINTHGNPQPEQHGDWIDLATSEDITLVAGESRIVPLGISMEIPTGWFADVRPRSSTFKKYGIVQTNSAGVIDNGYKGDGDIWGMPVRATRTTFIPKGTRICQFHLFSTYPTVKFIPVDSLNNEDRGGFGSTGE